MFSENKGADQLRGYREADLRLCFRICKKPVFSQRGSFCYCGQCFSFLTNESHHNKTCPRGFRPWSDTNRAVQPQKIVRVLKFRI